MSLFSIIGLVGFSIWSLYGFYRCLGQVIDKYEAKNTLHFIFLCCIIKMYDYILRGTEQCIRKSE